MISWSHWSQLIARRQTNSFPHHVAHKQLELTFLDGRSDTFSATMTLSEAEGVVADAVDLVSVAGYSAP
jgi:hypothetical protein